MDCVGLLLAETQMPQVRCMGLRPGNQATVRSVRAPDFTPTLPAPKPFVRFFLQFVRQNLPNFNLPYRIIPKCSVHGPIGVATAQPLAM